MENNHLIADIPQKAFIVHDGRVLVVSDKKGMWELPGGRLNIGEQPEEGLRRELREELDLEIRVDRPLHTFVFTSSATGQVHHVVIFACTPMSPLEAMRMDPSEVTGTRWIGQADLTDIFMRDGYKDFLKKYFLSISS